MGNFATVRVAHWQMAGWTKVHAGGVTGMSKAAGRQHLSALMEIPGVGEKTAEDLWEMGIKAPAEMRGRNPRELYDTLCTLKGSTIDPCMLYIFRCAVYYVSNERHDPERLKWWNWKND
jgi:hypothetical protein